MAWDQESRGRGGRTAWDQRCTPSSEAPPRIIRLSCTVVPPCLPPYLKSTPSSKARFPPPLSSSFSPPHPFYSHLPSPSFLRPLSIRLLPIFRPSSYSLSLQERALIRRSDAVFGKQRSSGSLPDRAVGIQTKPDRSKRGSRRVGARPEFPVRAVALAKPPPKMPEVSAQGR